MEYSRARIVESPGGTPQESAFYRRDIDGLRGLAVGLVVLFHAFPTTITGGFVGVDVFFVISGFLISGIIFSKLDQGRFSFVDFYERRSRRIFPALVLVLVTVLVFGWTQLHARAYAIVAQQSAAGAAFASNILSWTETGYFSAASETKPLLHLWSLGIEEQFYLVWPPLLVAVWRWKDRLVPIILALAAASFAANVLRIDRDPSGTFYLPFTRLWELLIGAYVARAKLPDSVTKGRNATALSVVGVALILYASFFFDARAFPGWRATFPVLGTLALLVAGPTALVNRTVFSTRASVAVGLISYPLYLWHWPLLTFGFLLKGKTPPTKERLIAIALSVVLAWGTYAWLEKRVRFGKHLRQKAIASFLGLAVIGGVSAFIWKQKGLPKRAANQIAADVGSQLAWDFDIDVHEKTCIDNYGFQKELAAKEAIFCAASAPPDQVEVVVFGDSISNSLYYGLAKALKPKHVGVLHVGMGTCSPFRGQGGTFQWNASCASVMDRIYKIVLENPRIHTAILAFDSWDFDNMNYGLPAGPNAPKEEKFKAVTERAKKDIEALQAAHKRVVVSFDAPHLGHGIEPCIEGPGRKADECRFPDPKTMPIMRFLPWWRDFFAPMHDVCVFDQVPPLERNGGLYVTDASGRFLFRDDHHVTYFGSDIVASAFLTSRCGSDL